MKGEERREWTHACTIVGRAYFLARFPRSHLPLAEKHLMIRVSSWRLVTKTSSLSYLAPGGDSPSQFPSLDHPIPAPCSPTYFLPSPRLLLFVAILSKACFKIQRHSMACSRVTQFSLFQLFVKLNFAAIPYHYLQNPCYVSSVINAAMRRPFKLKSKIAHQILETSLIYFVKIPVQFPQINPFSGELWHGD